jgi:hypothetical protein
MSLATEILLANAKLFPPPLLYPLCYGPADHRVNTIQKSHFLLISALGIFPVRHVLSECPKVRPSPPENILTFKVPGRAEGGKCLSLGHLHRIKTNRRSTRPKSVTAATL